MNLEESPRLPKIPFILGDVILIAAAWLIAENHPNPYAPLPIMIISVCLIVGALLLATPFIINYLRDQEEAALALRHEMAEQQRKLQAAIDHLTHSTSQLKTLEETSSRQIKSAEQLPYRLQEKIAEFNQQLAQSQDDDKEAAAQELAALRTSENERLEKISRALRDTVSEWNRIQTSAASLMAELQMTVSKAGTDIDKTASESRNAATAFLASLTQQNVAVIEEKLASLTSSIDSRLQAFDTAITKAEKSFREIPARAPRRREPSFVTSDSSSPESPVSTTPEPIAPVTPTAIVAPEPDQPTAPQSEPAPSDGTPPAFPIADTDASASEPEVVAPQAAPEISATTPEPSVVVTPPMENSAPSVTPAATLDVVVPEATSPTKAADTSAPELAETVPAPISDSAEAAPDSPATPDTDTAEVPAPAKAASKAARKRAQPEDDHPTLGLDLPPPSPDEQKAARIAAALLRDVKAEKAAPKPVEAHIPELITVPVDEDSPSENFSQLSPDEMPPLHTSTSPDGKTRITVTSYIGIGNKLYIRGDGPGLDWNKGVPLQFVSIGRWRWESADAAGPVNCRIYKNDRLESPVGNLTLNPGDSHEIAIAF